VSLDVSRSCGACRKTQSTGPTDRGSTARGCSPRKSQLRRTGASDAQSVSIITAVGVHLCHAGKRRGGGIQRDWRRESCGI
jgi:hypothetical protein